LRLEAKWLSFILINVHAPTNKNMEQIREKFYSLLEQNINQIARSNTKIILGDLNAKVCKESIYKPTIGNESLHNETNNGTKMVQFAISKGLNVQSTTFPHKFTNRHGSKQMAGLRTKLIEC
jgi:exonuclease III